MIEFSLLEIFDFECTEFKFFVAITELFDSDTISSISIFNTIKYSLYRLGKK